MEELDAEDILRLYKIYQRDTDVLLQIAVWALTNHALSIEEELNVSTEHRKRLEHVVVKMYAPEMPEKEYLN